MNWKELLNNNRLRSSTRANELDARNDFESDFGRIIFSPAMRRMHDKTQVFPLTTDDNIHTRLTHSMEVMAIGHSLGIALCENSSFQMRTSLSELDLLRRIPVLLKNSCLIHDIGNPPFGHFGERIIQNYFNNFFNSINTEEATVRSSLTEKQMDDFRLFDGNAQGLRVLTKLQMLNDNFGLNLTYATLGAYIKYPNDSNIDKSYVGYKKRGVFTTEIDFFKTISQECGMVIEGKVVRHPLSFLMEAADSICYLAMDMEDGFNKRLYEIDYLFETFSSINFYKEKIQKIQSSSSAYGDRITKMVKLRIFLIQELVNLSIKNFLDNIEEIESGKFSNELINIDENKLAETIQKICNIKIFPNRDIVSLELTGHSVIKGLLDYYIGFFFHKDDRYRQRANSMISETILKTAFIENDLPETSNVDQLSEYYKYRVIVDYISGMTDQFALNHHQRISGQKIN